MSTNDRHEHRPASIATVECLLREEMDRHWETRGKPIACSAARTPGSYARVCTPSMCARTVSRMTYQAMSGDIEQAVQSWRQEVQERNRQGSVAPGLGAVPGAYQAAEGRHDGEVLPEPPPDDPEEATDAPRCKHGHQHYCGHCGVVKPRYDQDQSDIKPNHVAISSKPQFEAGQRVRIMPLEGSRPGGPDRYVGLCGVVTRTTADGFVCVKVGRREIAWPADCVGPRYHVSDQTLLADSVA